MQEYKSQQGIVKDISVQNTISRMAKPCGYILPTITIVASRSWLRAGRRKALILQDSIWEFKYGHQIDIRYGTEATLGHIQTELHCSEYKYNQNPHMA